MLFVVEHLKHFADEDTRADMKPDSLVTDLRDFVVPDLESTIEAFLENLKLKCKFCKEFRGAAL